VISRELERLSQGWPFLAVVALGVAAIWVLSALSLPWWIALPLGGGLMLTVMRVAMLSPKVRARLARSLPF
jgi:hypothetical protein